MQALASFVQISDLHFAPIDSEHGLSCRTPQDIEQKRWRDAPPFPGLEGHSDQAIRDLNEFFEQIGRGDPDICVDDIAGEKGSIYLIVTGDLTRRGEPQEFEAAVQYLSSRVRLKDHHIGLNNPDWVSRSIVGNHDFWDGQVIPLLFRQGQIPIPQIPTGRPDTQTTICVGTRWKVRFIRVNSDEGVWHPGAFLDRNLARGDFGTQLDVALNDLPAKEEGELRVLLLHHAPTWKSPTRTGDGELIANSCRMLEKFTQNAQIDIMLAGHVHRPDFHLFPVNRKPEDQCFEVWCGTTTQETGVRTRISQYMRVMVEVGEGTLGPVRQKWNELVRYRRREFTRRAAKIQPNTLIVHSIIEHRDKISWRAIPFLRTIDGFQRARLSKDGFTNDTDPSGHPPIEFWPR